MLWLGLNTQEPWISPHNTTHSRESERERGAREGGLQNELKTRETNRTRGKRDAE